MTCPRNHQPRQKLFDVYGIIITAFDYFCTILIITNATRKFQIFIFV